MAWHTTSRHKRGYGSSWDKVRKSVLKRDNYLCRCDECKGGKLRYRLASEVHHILSKAKGGTDSKDNLIAINTECHKRITAAEQGRTLKTKVRTGLDGYPMAHRDRGDKSL